MINVLVNGSKGNMGKVVINYIRHLSDMKVVYEVDKNSQITSYSHDKKPDVIIDFSTVNGTFAILDDAIQHLIPIVIATTGFSDEENKKIREYAEAIPIFKSSNMSYGIHLIAKMLSSFSLFLANMDIEIVEKHHRKKVDAPSRNGSPSCGCN